MIDSPEDEIEIPSMTVLFKEHEPAAILVLVNLVRRSCEQTLQVAHLHNLAGAGTP